jgi:hypothetical protein
MVVFLTRAVPHFKTLLDFFLAPNVVRRLCCLIGFPAGAACSQNLNI